MSTTVPQNISKTNVGGRHKPTRSSLRHSRMLVLKNMEGSYLFLPLNFYLINFIIYYHAFLNNSSSILFPFVIAFKNYKHVFVFTGNRNLYALDIDCRLLARICYTALLVSGMLIGTICLGILLWAPNTSGKNFIVFLMFFVCYSVLIIHVRKNNSKG